MNTLHKKVLRVALSVALFALGPVPVFASAEMTLEAPQSAQVGERFSVRVLLDPEQGVPLNVVGGTISYPSAILTLQGIVTDGSIVEHWIERPSSGDDRIRFAGAIPGGFSGFIDPVNFPDGARPGTVVTLVFRAQAEGAATLSFQDAGAYIHDGTGSRADLTAEGTRVSIEGRLDDEEEDLPSSDVTFVMFEEVFYEEEGEVIPLLIFAATDPEYGISFYEIREDGGAWERAESPARISEDARVVEVRAESYSGRSATASLERDPAPDGPSFVVFVLLALLAVALGMYTARRRRRAMAHDTLNNSDDR